MCDGRLSRPACLPSSILNPNLVAMTTSSRNRRQRFAHQFFVGERTVDLGRIEERHTRVDCRPNNRDSVFAGRGGPYPKLIPMQPKPSADTSSPLVPNLRFCIPCLCHSDSVAVGRGIE